VIEFVTSKAESIGLEFDSLLSPQAIDGLWRSVVITKLHS
jgi:hypothetical protein